MRKMLLLAFIAAVAVIPPDCSAQPELTVTLLNPNIQVFRVGDFDFTNAMNNPLIFQVDIVNDAIGRVVFLSLSVVSRRHGVLGTGKSTPNTMSANRALSFTNRDLGASDFEFKINEFSVETAGEELRDVVENTGSLPADTYTFTLQLLDVDRNDEVVAEDGLDITVDNPNTLELIGPGTRFGGELVSITWPPPPFQWISQAKTFNFVLVELVAGQSSGEEALDNQPVYRQMEFESRFSGSHSLTYPSSAEAFQDGRTYCWQVEAIVTTSGGEEIIPSEVFWFKVGRRELAPVTNVAAQITNLLSLLPPDLLGDTLLELEGFAPTGNVAIEGRQITVEELRAIIDQIRRGKPGDAEVFVR